MGSSSCRCTKRTQNSSKTTKTSSTSKNRGLYLDRLAQSQIRMIRAKFNAFAVKGAVDLNGFKKLLPEGGALTDHLQEAAFRVLNDGVPGFLTYQELCAGIGQHLLGNYEAKCNFLFSLLDPNGTGSVSAVSLLKLTENSLGRSGASTLLNHPTPLKLPEFIEWALGSLDINKALSPFELIPSARTEKELVKSLLKDLGQSFHRELWNVVDHG